MSDRSAKDGECEEGCTCTGGPYIHGPVGRQLVLASARLKKIREQRQKEGEK